MSITDKDDLLQKAIAEGIISEEQRERLAALAANDKGDSEERLKPVGNFNEIFVTIGVALFGLAASGLIATITPGVTLGATMSAVMYMGIAEYFDRRKRFRLPIIYAALSCAVATATVVMAAMVPEYQQIFDNDQYPSIWIVTLTVAMVVLAAFSWRYVVPFLILPISILFTVIITIAAESSEHALSLKLVLGAAGLAILAFAVRCDLKDPERVSRLSDYAFWAYMVGSPLFVHSLFLSVLLADDTSSDWVMGAGAWLLTLLMVLAVSFAGLLLNRRALITSTLIYVAFIIVRALGKITDGGSIVTILLVTMLIIGIYVMALGSRWREVRRRVIARLPAWKWLAKLPVV